MDSGVLDTGGWANPFLPASTPTRAVERPGAHAESAPGRTKAEADARLIAAVIDGDEQSFHELIERHHARVFRLVHGIIVDWHHAEDVCQDVFTTVYRKLPGFERRAQFSTWLYRVAVNAALKARRKWKRHEPKPLEVAADLAGRADGAPAFEGDEVFVKLLRPLPEKLRVAVVLREQGRLSYDEIASVLKCSRGAVEQRLHRAMTHLREIWLPKAIEENLVEMAQECPEEAK